MRLETIFTMDTSSIKFGVGATREVGTDIADLGVRRAMVVTDPHMASSESVAIVLDSLRAEGIDAVLYDRSRVEPTDASFLDAIQFAVDGKFDGYVAVGGGSSIDTAKAANLYATYPADFLTYVNPPIGEGRPVPGKLRPLIAVPTTAGTGSETTGVAIFDYEAMHAKTGIAHRALRPVLGIIDPDNTRTLPRLVAACTGLDVLSHALESLTALPYTQRAAPDLPKLRPAYQGANPISHIWAAQAIELVARYLVRAVQDPEDDEARGQMLMAATLAGIGFGNAGVHLPHGMAYPVAGMAKSLPTPYLPDGYRVDHALVPHGMAVILNAPAVFRFTAPANPALHLEAARLMGADIRGALSADAGDLIAERLVEILRATGMPDGLAALGYGPEHVTELVAGTLPQHRVTKLSPRPASAEDLRDLFLASMTVYPTLP